MNEKDSIFLPGSFRQYELLSGKTDIKGKKILVIGAGSEPIVKNFSKLSETAFIVKNYESLLNARLVLSETEVQPKLMEFDNTDFNKEEFDIVFAQASISNSSRNKIVKEAKRILKPAGLFCVGEMVSLEPEPPQFVKDVWETSQIIPLKKEEIEHYYTQRNFEIILYEDLSSTLKEFYSTGVSLLKETDKQLSENEKTYNKKILTRIKHEANVYLKLGGDRYMSFSVLILKKK